MLWRVVVLWMFCKASLCPLANAQNKPTLKSRCSDLYFKLSPSWREIHTLIDQHLSLKLAAQNATKKTKAEILQNYPKHLRIVAKKFNDIFKDTGLYAVPHIPETQSWRSFKVNFGRMHIEIKLKNFNNEPPKSHFEKLFKQVMRRDPTTRILYQPLEPHLLYSLAQYDSRTNTISVSVRDLFSIDTFPTAFWHEHTHQVILNSYRNHLNRSVYGFYHGNISGKPTWATSGYLLQNAFMPFSELQTFWIMIPAHINNLKTRKPLTI